MAYVNRYGEPAVEPRRDGISECSFCGVRSYQRPSLDLTRTAGGFLICAHCRNHGDTTARALSECPIG